MNKSEEKTHKGVIEKVEDTGRKDKYGNKSYQIVFKDGFECLKGYKDAPKVSAGNEEEVTYVTYTGTTNGNDWVLNSVVKVASEEAAKEERKNNFEGRSAGKSDKTSLVHEMVYLHSAIGQIALGVKDHKDADDYLATYEKIKNKFIEDVYSSYASITGQKPSV